MSSKLLVLISTGEKEKAKTGLMYAHRTMGEGWMDEVKVLFFGPSERLLLEDEDVRKMAQQIAIEEKPVACKTISGRERISAELEKHGMKVDYVDRMISNPIKEGFTPLVF